MHWWYRVWFSSFPPHPPPIRQLHHLLAFLDLLLWSSLQAAVLAVQLCRCSHVGTIVQCIHWIFCVIYPLQMLHTVRFDGVLHFCVTLVRAKVVVVWIVVVSLPDRKWLSRSWWKVISCSTSCTLEEGWLYCCDPYPLISIGLRPLPVQFFPCLPKGVVLQVK